MKSIPLKNYEGIKDYFINPSYLQNRKTGISAILRIKNEEEFIKPCILSIINFFDEITIGLNDCTDNTPYIVKKLALSHSKIKVFKYNFKLNHIGGGHNSIPYNSVHDCSYFYNWLMSKTTYSHICKWDGDMVALPRLYSLKREIMNYDVFYIKGINLVDNLFGYISKYAPLASSEPRFFKITKKTFYVQSHLTQVFSDKDNTNKNGEKEASFLHFKNAKKINSRIQRWPKDWEKRNRFKSFFCRGEPGKVYKGDFPVCLKQTILKRCLTGIDKNSYNNDMYKTFNLLFSLRRLNTKVSPKYIKKLIPNNEDEKFQLFLKNTITILFPWLINKLIDPHLGGGSGKGNFDNEILKILVNKFNIKTMLDVGCGKGLQVENARKIGIDAHGVDGSHQLLIYHEDYFHKHDFTQGEFITDEKDLSWSIEFLEHVEEKYLNNIFSVFKKSKYVFITHGLPKQGGYHHVNCQNEEYWIEKFAQNGFEYDKKTSNLIKSISSCKWIRRTGKLFINKKHLNPKTKYDIKKQKLFPIFLHVPRTGGNSILNSFSNIRSWGHRTPLYIKNEIINPKDFNNSFKFTITRNPYDRLVSSYFYIMQTHKNHRYYRTNKLYLEKLSKIKNFEEFCKKINYLNKKKILYLYPQHGYICDTKTNIVANKVFKFEEIDSTFRELRKIFGKNTNKTIPKKNSSNHRSWKEYYTQETREIVYNFYKKDFELFGYDK